VITLFSIPKPFAGPIDAIQTNAVCSWGALGPDVQVVLLGDEAGVAEAAAAAGVEHVRDIDRNEFGTPRLDDAFARIDEIARNELRCFVNGDIILLDDFLPAVRAASAARETFLMIGVSRNLRVDRLLALDEVAEREALRRRAEAEGTSRGATAIDYFVFRAGLFDPMPAFVVWRARQRGIVVDASAAVLAVHQEHDYAHVEGGLLEAHSGAEADRNLELAGGKQRLFTIYDSSHRLTKSHRVRKHFGAVGRVRENLRKIAWKLAPR
jgi:hypothetical protein